MQWSRYDEVLLVRAIAVRWVVCVLATTQPNSGVFLWDESQWGQALGFEFVGAIAEGLKGKDVVRENTGCTFLYFRRDDVEGGFTCFLLCPQVHHE